MKFDFKEDFLSQVQRIVRDLKQLQQKEDPDGLSTPLIEIMIGLRDRVAHGPVLNTETSILAAWQRLDDILDHHQCHYAHRQWFQDIRGMVTENRAGIMPEIEKLRGGADVDS